MGLFICRISRGHTIRSVVGYSFLAPLFYAFIWFCVFGGSALRQARHAEELIALGEKLGDKNMYLIEPEGYCYEVPQEPVVSNGTVVYETLMKGITPVCVQESATQDWFNLMYSFRYPDDNDGFAGFGGFMAGLSIIALAIYFVTSSDSGSLVVDHLASNGQKFHHWSQRVFWAFTEGALATALLVAGGTDALDALKAASIVLGLPFNLLIYGMMYCSLKQCRMAEAEKQAGTHRNRSSLPPPEERSFAMPLFGGILNFIEYVVSCGNPHYHFVERGMDKPTTFQVKEFFLALVLPFASLWRVCTHLEWGIFHKTAFTVVYTLLHFAWIALCACSVINFGFVAFGLAAFFSNAVIIVMVRGPVREAFEVEGNPVTDSLAGSFYPQVLTQMLWQFERQTHKMD